MSRLAVIVLAVFIVTISVRCLAERLDDSESQQLYQREPDNVAANPEDVAVDRSASPEGFAPIGNRFRQSYAPTQIRLVECYACTDCPKVLANTTSKFCPYTNDITKNNKCVVYVEKYSQIEKPWYIRGCASERGSCGDIIRAHENDNARMVKLLYCSECDGDKCNTNGVYRSLPNLAAAILFVIVTPLVGKYALS